MHKFSSRKNRDLNTSTRGVLDLDVELEIASDYRIRRGNGVQCAEQKHRPSNQNEDQHEQRKADRDLLDLSLSRPQFVLHVNLVFTARYVQVRLDLGKLDRLKHIQGSLGESPVDYRSQLEQKRNLVPSFENVLPERVVLAKHKPALAEFRQTRPNLTGAQRKVDAEEDVKGN